MEGQVVMDMKIFRDIHWERHLVDMVYLREAPSMGCQVGRLMENLRDIHWESPLVQKVELR